MRQRRGGPLDVLILGAGISGLTAACQSARMGLSVGLVEKALPGGLVVNVGNLDGYPSARPTSGAELASALRNDAVSLGVQVIESEVTGLNLSSRPMAVETGTHAMPTHRARAIVLAMGAALSPFTVPGADRLVGHGVSQCAFCDAGLYQGETVVVVGGGNAALQEALHLTQFASEVVLVHRGNRLSAMPHYVARAAESPNMRFHWSTQVVEVLGRETVEGVRMTIGEGEEASEISCRGVFPFVGLVPQTELLPEGLLGRDGAVDVDELMATSMPGVYAIGALRAGFGGQLTNAVSDGSIVARSVAAYLG